MAKIIRTWSEKYKTREGEYDRGGNGVVSKVTDIETETQTLVIKELSKDCFSEEKKARFIEEIDIMSNNYRRIKGIMPVYDYSKEEYWYAMPEAELLINYIERLNIGFDERIDLIISFAEILKRLHENGISHRDIKPLNLYMLNSEPFFGDFGLADFPDKASDFTKSDRGLGAVFTIAPEMKRDPKLADGKKADVYSFAKTAWMIITLDEKGFDGQYNRKDSVISISENDNYKGVHLREFEDLLTSSTNNDPDYRPTIEQFLEELKLYRDIKSDRQKSQLSDWKYLSNQIFGENEPTSCCWENINAIITILNVIGKNPAYNHMFYSSNGGLDFERAQIAAEEGCIEIYTGGKQPDIVKPKRLIYQGFEEDFSWNYFLLELDELEPVEPFRWEGEYEVLVEDTAAHYVPSDYSQYGVYDYDTGEKFPDGWKLVRRYKKGKILFTFKSGGYNSIVATYDGRHGKCSAEEFYNYIKEMVSAEKTAKERGYDVRSFLNYCFKKNPFEIKTKNKEMDEDEQENKILDDDYLANNYASWIIDIGDFCINKESNIRFKIVFDKNGGRHDFSSLFDEKHEIVLSKDGTLKMDINPDEVMWLSSREDALKAEAKLDLVIRKECMEHGYKYPEYRTYTSIDIDKCGVPEHLFTKEELVEVLKNADDRHANTVVINENGMVCLVEENEYLYPVRNETFQAGNKYVGKYADVIGVADDLYPSLLGAWIDYLKLGKRRYIDCYEYSNKDVDELEAKAKELIAQC